MRVLISGAGIAGPTLAYWLLHYGYKPTILETAPHLRTGGYVIDFWGAGYDVADRMGLLPEICRKGYAVQEIRVVGASGKRLAGFSADAFSRMTRGRFVSLPRGDLAASIFEAIEDKVEMIFGNNLNCVEQTKDGVAVTFESGETASSISSSAQTGFIRAFATWFTGRRFDLSDIWDTKWPHSRPRATDRGTNWSM
jgi:2-polyprenyl-6-methoxyphenol hydroxylase-like FAD-dependent oxidoreductase